MRRLHRLLLVVTLAVIPAAAQITVNPPALANPQWTQGVAYSQTFSASGCLVLCLLSIPPGEITPHNLNFSPQNNTLSGVPTTTGTITFTVTATEMLNTGTRTYSLNINAPPSITTTTLPAGTVGSAYTGAVVATGGTAPLGLSLTSGTIPPGLSFTSGGTFTGIPTTAGTYSFTVTVTDLAGVPAAKPLSITINAAPPTITTTSLPATSVGATYNQTIAYTPGTIGTHTFSIPPGTLPNGLNISAGGVISGTPTTAGTFNFTVTVTDSVNATGSKALSIVVNPAPTITTTSLPSGTQTSTYSTSLAATGGTGSLTFSATGLPSWLNLSAAGVLSGTPTAPGDFPITFRITDSVGAFTEKPLTISVTALPIISTLSPSSATAGAQGFTLTVTGSGFVSGSTVQWASTALATTFVSATQLTAVVAANLISAPGSVNVTVVNPGPVTSAPAVFTIGGAPAISSLSPSSAIAGAPTFTLTVSGSNFVAASVVQWASAALATTFVNANQLTAVVPANLVAAAGSVNVTVVNPGPVTSAPAVFTIGGAPSISSLSPSSAVAGAPAFTLTVTGTNFLAGSNVQWASTALATTFVSATQLTAAVPANLVAAAGSANVTVVNPGPVTSAPSVFTIGAAPAISLLTPSSISAGAPAFNLTVSGSGFVSTSIVQWAGTPLSTTFVSATQLSAAVPAVLLVNPGAVNITVVNPGPVTSAPAVFTVGAAPSITAINPIATTAGAPIFTLTVTGSGFNATSVIRLAGQALVTTFLSPNQLSTLITQSMIPAAATVSVTVANAGPVVSNAASLLVNPQTQFITSTLAPGLIGVAYSQALNISGGTPPFQFAFTNGNFPPGLSLNPTNGAITGTPSTAGSYDFAIQITDAAGFVVTRIFNLVIARALSISTEAALPTGAVGLAYSVQLAATGGLPPYSNWLVTTGTLPPGINLNATTGLLSGTPTATSSYAFLIQVRDSAAQVANKGFTLVINAGLSITSTSQPPTAIIGTAFQFALTAAGGTQPYTWSVAIGTLPAGLTLNTSNGAITGTPATAGTSTVTIEVKDTAGQTARAPYTFEVVSGLSITNPTALPTATARVAYSTAFQASGGTAPYSNWRIVSGAVPAALVLNSLTGVLSGTPANPGDYSFTIAVNDSTSRTVSKAFTLTVLPPGLAITSSAALPAATFGTPYSFTLEADGGTTPYRWVLASGSLPAGLNLASTGVISGTPTAAGSFSFIITVLDSSSTRSSSRDFTLAVNSPALPAYTLSGPADTIDAATQQTIALGLASSYPSALSGTVVITFVSDTVNAPPSASDDPALQFANGSRTIRFTIPAGSTSAQFEGTPALQAGTVAGTIVLTSSFATGSTSVPSVTPPRTIRILRAAPSVRTAAVTRTASGFDVTITGFSTPREVTQALFRFTAASGANLQTNELTLPLTTPATAWFTSDASRAFGGQFTYRQSFTLSGESNAIASLSVTLSNSTGASQPVSANVP